MICPNCGKELPDGTKFCGGCGTPISASQSPVSAQPVTPVKPVAPVKPVVPVKPAAPVAAAPAGEKKGFDVQEILGKVKETVKKVPTKYLKIAGIALAAILVVILVANLFGGGSEPNYALYIKDEQVFYHDFSKKAPYQVTEDYDSNDGSYFRYYAHMTADGETLFYYDDGDLYYRSLTNMKKEPVKLDSSVDGFHVSENGKLVTYMKNGKLIQHNLKKEEVIAKDVSSVKYISDDGKIIYYWTEDGEFMCWNNGKEEELDDDISEVLYVSEDFKTIYYVTVDEDNADIFSKKVGKDAEVIAEGACDATDVSEDGSFYYMMYPEGDCEDYITDAEDYGLEGQKMDIVQNLYYFNGSKSTLVAENVSVTDSSSDINGNTLIYYVRFGTLEEDSLSYEEYLDMVYNKDMSYDEAMIEWLTDATGEAVYTMSVEGKTTEVELEDLYTLRFAPDGKSVYALCDVDDNGEGTLYKASVSGGKVKDFKEIDSDVYYSNMNFGYQNIDGEYACTSYMYYYKDVKDGEGTLCADGKEIDSDVYVQYLSYSEGQNLLLYYVDYKDGEGMLKGYNGKKAVEICDEAYSFTVAKDGAIAVAYDYSKGEFSLAVYDKKLKEVGEDVYSYMFTPDGDILYLMDYSTEKWEGDLYWYNGSKSKLLDEDVVSLIRIYDCTDGCVFHD